MTKTLTILGQNPAILWAVWQNLLSWCVRTFAPSLLPRLVPPCPEEQQAASKDASRNDDDDDDTTRCILIGRPGGMEQLRLVTLKPGKVTCGYNLCNGGPFADTTTTTTISTSAAAAAAVEPDCVILKVHAFSVNYADCCIRWGLYESAKKFVGYPICPGFDVAGVVEHVGPVSQHQQASPMSGNSPPLQKGDKVFGCSLFGAYSTRAMVPAIQLRRLPSNLSSMTEAAALPAVALTALYALVLAGHYPTRSKLSNRAILIHSAAGGVGSMLVQMSNLLELNPIVGVVGQTSKVEEAQKLGCHVVIDKSACSSEAELWNQIHQASPNGYSTVMESNGVATIEQSYQHLCMTGRLISYGFHTNLPLGKDMLSPLEWIQMARKASHMPKFDAMEMGAQNKAILCFNLSFFAQEREMLSELFDQVCVWLEQGKLQCPRITTFEMEQIAQAHEYIQSGASVGKIVMTTGSV